MASRFKDWQAKLPQFNAELQQSLGTMKVSLHVQGNPPRMDLMKMMADFAKEFMQNGFVETFVKPAFMEGRGLPGFEPYEGNPFKFMPQAVAFKSKDGARKRGEHKKSRLDRAIERGDWRTIQRIQAEDKKNEFGADGPDSTIGLDNTAAGPNNALADIGGKDFAIGKWRKGFEKLLEAMTKVATPQIQGNSIVVNMGSGTDLLSEKLGYYSVTRGQESPSHYDSFFYAAEFGTGIGDNVGGPQWIRDEVKGIQHQKVSYKGVYGHWWYGHKLGQHWYGALFSGQRGLHFLYEPATRKPRPQFKQWIENNLQKQLAVYLSHKTGGAIRIRGVGR